MHLYNNTPSLQGCGGNKPSDTVLTETTFYEGPFAKCIKSPGHRHNFGPEILFL